MKKTILAASAALVLAVALSACDRQPQQVAYVPTQQVVAPAPMVVQQPVVVAGGYSAGDVAAAAALGVAAGSMFNYGGHYYAHDYRGYYYIDHGRRYYDPRPPYSVTHHNYTVINNAPAVRPASVAPAAPQVVQPTRIAQPISANPQGGISLAKAPAAPAQTFRPVAARSFTPAPARSTSSFRPTSARK